jgi:predicted kinase
LRHHYLAYRAFVRTKVACLRHAQGDDQAAADAVRHTQLTADHLRAGEVALVLVGGRPGTGKSTVAGQLADRLGAVVLGSDRIRKELAGLAPDASAAAPYRQGIYTAGWTDRTYGELLSRAAALLRRGETVIVDASWAAVRYREAAKRVAADTHARLVALRCHCAREVAADRLRSRVGDVSDADPSIAAAMAGTADPWPEAATVRTEGTPGDSTAEAARLVRPHRFGSFDPVPAGGDQRRSRHD